MKKYIAPNMNILKFGNEDVMTASSPVARGLGDIVKIGDIGFSSDDISEFNY